MLVVVHHGDVEALLQTILDIEALRRLDVLEVDTAKGGGDTLNSLAELLWILLGHLDIKHVDTTIDLEKQSLTFHHRFAAHGADVAQTEHGCTIGDYGNEVALIRVFVSCIRVFLNFQTRKCNARRVS